MIAEVYDTLLAAGAPEEKARKAAETLANYNNEFAKIELELELMAIQGELNLLKWMLGFVLVSSVAILIKLLV